jgi:hypothetical protein
MTIVSLINGLSARRKSQGRIDGYEFWFLSLHMIQDLFIGIQECGFRFQSFEQTPTGFPVRDTSQINACDCTNISSHVLPQSGIQNECGQDLYHPDFPKSIRRQATFSSIRGTVPLFL